MMTSEPHPNLYLTFFCISNCIYAPFWGSTLEINFKRDFYQIQKGGRKHFFLSFFKIVKQMSVVLKKFVGLIKLKYCAVLSESKRHLFFKSVINNIKKKYVISCVLLFPVWKSHVSLFVCFCCLVTSTRSFLR